MRSHVVLAAILATGCLPAQEPTVNQSPLPFREERVAESAVPVPSGASTFSIRGAFVGTLMVVDAKFATENGHSLPTAPFRILVPRVDNLVVLPGGEKTGIPELVKITSVSPDRKAIEILRLTELTVPRQVNVAERLKICAQLLQDKAYKAVTNGYKAGDILEVYATKIGDSDAVCLHAHMASFQTDDHYAVKLVGILDPESDGGVFAFLMADTKLSEIKEPLDLRSKGKGLSIIHSLEFFEEK